MSARRMSFNSAFLSPKSQATRDREAREALEAERADAARSYYTAANFLVVATFLLIALPQLGLSAWNVYIIGAVGLVVTVLAILMMVKGAVWNGMLSLIFALIFLPGWLYIAPNVTKVVYEQYLVIKKEWVTKVGPAMGR